MLTTSDYRDSIIATACWRAAQGEPSHVMLCVCLVLLNRSLESGIDVYDEATKWLTENPGDFPDPRDPQFQQLLSRMGPVLAGEVSDKTGGALWCVPKDKLAPGSLSAFTITTTIGNLLFLR